MPNIILIGFMGSGKTTIGERLADRMGLPFIDTDHEIERLKGMSIDQIFKEEGEMNFRELEKKLIASLSVRDQDFVIAVGGGLPCYNGLIHTLNQMGTTVYLKCPVSLLAERLVMDSTDRPLLSNLDKEQLVGYIEEKLKEREAFYEQAKVVICDDWSANAILRSLLPQKS
ncbi:MAG: shikimate kinase [Flavobacteriia bacterium]|jgi:shikimate kinase